MARLRLRSAAAGIAAVALGAGLGELLAAVLIPASSPFASIGGALIDIAPSWAKETAIALFGTADKIALIIACAVVALVIAAAAGVLEARRRPWGSVLCLLFGAVGAVVAATRPDAGGFAWLPAVVAGTVAALVLGPLVRLAVAPAPAAAPVSATSPSPAPAPAPSPVPPPPLTSPGDAPRDPARRRFLGGTVAATAAGVLAAVAGAAVQAGSAAVTAVRAAVRLPAPAAKAPPVPAGAELDIPGLAPVVTPADRFYRIDTAIAVPQIDPATWSLRIHGMVEQEVVLTWDELLALPLEESYTTLTCVSNPVGGDLIGNALWLGHPLRELLARAQPTADADMVLSRSIDGFTASTPLEILQDDRNAILAVGMNGEPLPPEHGFPVRMVVPGLYGYVSATKWVTELEVTRFDRARAYWTDRGWSERGPIKLQSRIDVPRRKQGLKAGDTVIAGVAWQQHVGISGVEVRIDEGEWMPATLATAISADTWVQWSMPWRAEVGQHVIQCRAIDAAGEVQTGEEVGVIPDGATGWDYVVLDVFA